MEVLTSIVTAVLGWLDDMIDLFIANPITLVPAGVGVVGGIIGLTKKLFGGLGRRR